MFRGKYTRVINVVEANASSMQKEQHFLSFVIVGSRYTVSKNIQISPSGGDNSTTTSFSYH